MENRIEREWKYRSRRGGHVFLGGLITLVGVILLLNNLGVIDARDIFRIWLWPLVIIAFGIVHLVRARSSQ
jgi:hypothetical protein